MLNLIVIVNYFNTLTVLYNLGEKTSCVENTCWPGLNYEKECIALIPLIHGRLRQACSSHRNLVIHYSWIGERQCYLWRFQSSNMTTTTTTTAAPSIPQWNVISTSWLRLRKTIIICKDHNCCWVRQSNISWQRGELENRLAKLA